MASRIVTSSLVVVLISSVLLLGANAQLRSNFYDTSCPNATTIVQNVLNQAQQNDVTLAAKLVRVHFHDCFVDGCDASVLLDTVPGIESEREAIPNLSLGALNVIDDIKTALENVCPGVVSCADILAMAAQITVTLTGGPSWTVQLGRRDSLTAANVDAVENDLPGPRDGLASIRNRFAELGLTSTDLVALSGAHTFGKARCSLFRDRLYNFSGTGNPDPTLNETYLATLSQSCPITGNNDTLFDLEPVTPNGFDNSYFSNLENNRGLLQSDQELFSTTGSETVSIVSRFSSSQADFFTNFGQSMIKMGNINPKFGTQGEIRKDCKRVN